jgi:hypothetical protein
MTSFLESIGLDGSGTITEKLARYTEHLDSLDHGHLLSRS